MSWFISLTKRFRGYRPGMAMRIAIGFAAVAITVITANFITQQSASEARHRVRQLLLQHEPLVRTTETLAAAVSQYERVVVDQIETTMPEAEVVDSAVQQMQHAAAEYLQTAMDLPEHEAPAEFPALLARFEALGKEVLEKHAARNTRLREFWARFDELEATLNAPQDRATRFAGAVFASERVLHLAARLSEVREQVSAATSTPTPKALQHIIARENAFRGYLQQHGAELTALHGAPWFREVSTRFGRAVAARREVLAAMEASTETTALFRDKGAELGRVIVTQVIEPARSALADADRLARRAAERADSQLVWASSIVMLLLIIISIATVGSVAGPVRRLTNATRQLSSGAAHTRVTRGGVREVDALAEAFNDMAAQLQRAQSEVRAYQLELEHKVDERTRELNHLAHHDALTDMPNRRQLFAHLEEAIARGKKEGSRTAVLFIDLDHFKNINDSLGHAFGDLVLRAVGERLSLNSMFTRSFSARLGGDEFTVVCEGVQSLSEVERLCGMVLEAFQRSLSVHGRELRLSVSVGASCYPDHGDDPQALLRAADAALFRAKELGRNGFSLYAPELLEAASKRFKLEQALRRAVERSEFELVFQPEASFETLQTHTVEALVRWRRSDGALISPADFFDVAEHTGLITDISEWVLRTAIQTAAAWRKGPWPQARIAVNISSQQFMNGDFVERLKGLLAQSELPPEALEVELTETVLQTGPHTIAALHRLREVGVSIALDDFGVGYSSLTSLEQLPLTHVKIDRGLIASIDASGRSPAIVRSIVGLCHSIGLQVTAEGVERGSQLGVLLADRDVRVQGFLISRPLPLAAVPAFIEQSHAQLEALMLAAPTPVHDMESATSRLRVLRLSNAAKVGRSTKSEERV